ncbi:MAG: hypothetical protein ACQET1_01120 [Gemmatimonadota bacterium]
MPEKPRSVSRPVFVFAACLIHAVVLVSTTHLFIADAPNYASDIAQHLETFSCRFYEAGHLLWRPMGLVATSLTRLMQPEDPLVASAMESLEALAILFGFLCVGLTASWLHALAPTLGGAAFGVLFLVFGNAFINFAQVGTSYIPALAFLVLAMVLLAEASFRKEHARLFSGLAGLAFTFSVFLWGPFLLALPAGLLSMAVWKGFSRRTLGNALLAATTSAASAAAILAWVAFQLRLRSLADFAAWAGAASHGIDLVGGAPRAVMGFARSIVHLGDVGTLVKQYLVRDPMASVGLREILTFELALFALVYVFLAWMCWSLVRTEKGRRALALLLLAGAPVGYFAISWQGGDLERYLPLLPALTLAVAVAFSNIRPRSLSLVFPLGFMMVMVSANGSAMLSPRVEAAMAGPVARLEAAMSPHAPRILVVATHQDEAWQVQRNHPGLLAPYPGTDVVYLLLPGTPQVEDWRESFATLVLRAWERGKEIRLSGQLLSSTAETGWGWTEGEDPRVGWEDVTSFIAGFEVAAPPAPSPDRFFTLLPSAANRARLEALAVSTASTPEDRLEACRFPPRRALSRFRPPHRP